METRSRVVVLVWCSLTALFLIDHSSAHKAVPYIFGDSLYDTGMTLYNGVKDAGAQFYPYGETYFKKPAGRFSDGRLIPDFIAQFAGLPLPVPYLLPGLTTYTNGINFASASACVLTETRPTAISLKKQIDYFREMVQKMKQEIGEEEGNKVVTKAVYMFNIGGNDYAELVKRNINKTALTQSYINFYMNEVLGNLTTHLKSIYYQGGRKFAIQNIGPIGCFPTIRFKLGYNGRCAQAPSDIAEMHNVAFLNVLKNLETQLVGFKYTVYDFYSSLYKRVINGDRYGFRDTVTACCGSGLFNGDFTCQKKEDNFTVCGNPSNHLWFDGGHPTQKGDKQFAKEYWYGPSSIVAPYNLKTLFALN